MQKLVDAYHFFLLLNTQVKSDAISYSNVYSGGRKLGFPIDKTVPYIFLPSTTISPITATSPLLFFFFFNVTC